MHGLLRGLLAHGTDQVVPGGVLGGSYIKNWVRGPIAKCNLSARRRRETGPPQAKKSWVRAPYREKFLVSWVRAPYREGEGTRRFRFAFIRPFSGTREQTAFFFSLWCVCLPLSMCVRRF